MKLFKNKAFLVTVSVLLVVAIFLSGTLGILLHITRGEKINCKKAAESYNANAADTGVYFTQLSESEALSRMEQLDGLLSQTISSLEIEKLLYTDSTVTMIGKLLGSFTGRELSDTSFSSMKKSFPEAHSYITGLKESGADWEQLELIPFGITEGDKQAFIKACGAMGEFLGKEMLTMIIHAPGAYYDALVPLLEAFHTEKMPTLVGFALSTGLSGSKRVELIAERLLGIIEPLKQAPVTYLCSILPELILSYSKAADYINSNEKIRSSTGLQLPEIEDILKLVFDFLELSYMPVDLDGLSLLGAARVSEESAASEKVEIKGNAPAIFLFLAEYLLDVLVYEDNFAVVENMLTHTLKQLEPSDKLHSIVYSENTNRIIAVVADTLAMSRSKSLQVSTKDYIEEHNSRNVDTSHLFTFLMPRERYTSLISMLDTRLSEYFNKNNLDNIFFTDKTATLFASITAQLCHKELGEIPFVGLKRAYPEAYSYISGLQAQGKTWQEVELIPFGIENGDREAFIKACGAGCEHFGDALALAFAVAPTAYEEALMILLESLHTGAMPSATDFVSAQGLDSVRRMEIITEKLLTVYDEVKATPLGYLTKMLPDFLYSYGYASDFYALNPNVALTGIELPPLEQFLAELLEGTGISLPDIDFDYLISLSTANAAPSADRTGERVELTGDSEAICAALLTYVSNIISLEQNKQTISTVAAELFGINKEFIAGILNTVSAII